MNSSVPLYLLPAREGKCETTEDEDEEAEMLEVSKRHSPTSVSV